MYKMSDKEFYEVYGRMPRRTKKKKIKVYWHRVIVALIILILMIVGMVKLVKLIVGKFRSGGDKDTSSSVAAVDGDPSAEPGNKETDKAYQGIELTVCIDPAHGGFDKGTVADGRYEKDDTLTIALALKEHLESCGVKVVMTRTDDSFVRVEDRSRIANEQGADIMLSIHRGSNEIAGSDIQGFEAWIHNAEPSADKAFAEKIMSKLEEMGISENRGVRLGYPDDSSVNYAINEQTVMPSVLLNMGYVTSSIDDQLFDANLEAYARAIGNGMIETAASLGVIDDKGVRKSEGQLRSDKPAVKEEAPESKREDPEEENDREEEPYEEDPQEYQWEPEEEIYEEPQEEYLYTDDGMGYYTEPMMTE